MINIGATILEEGIALRASDIDLVYLNGYGFPVWRGGPMHWAGAVGLNVVAEGIRRYSNKSNLDHWKSWPMTVSLSNPMMWEISKKVRDSAC